MLKFKVPGDDTVYELLSSKFTFAEARAMEKATGHSFTEIMENPGAHDLTVTQALYWVSMKRQRPTLVFSELDDIPMEDIEFIPDDQDSPDPAPADPTDLVPVDADTSVSKTNG